MVVPFRFTRALQETRRPHIFVWVQSGHGQRAYFPTPTGGRLRRLLADLELGRLPRDRIRPRRRGH